MQNAVPQCTLILRKNQIVGERRTYIGVKQVHQDVRPLKTRLRDLVTSHNDLKSKEKIKNHNKLPTALCRVAASQTAMKNIPNLSFYVPFIILDIT